MSDPTAGPSSYGEPSGKKGGFVPSTGTVLRVLVGIQNVSGMVFTAFAGVHLISPVVASFGGITGADRSLVRQLRSSADDHC